jgi:DNA-directed RNA polymerase specialized sigma24 family protein
MHWSAQLQFQRLPPEAQRATLWRLAWSGLAPEQIAQRIGWSTDQVRRAMQDEMAAVMAAPGCRYPAGATRPPVPPPLEPYI